MEKYESNSHKSKEKQTTTPDKKVQKVIKGTAKIKKKSEFRKLADIFLPEDISSVKSYIVTDILFPAIRDGIEDVVHALLHGGASPRTGKTNYNRVSTLASKISYSSDNRKDYSMRARNDFNYDELIFSTRGDAEVVLNGMVDILQEYPAVSIGDMYDLAQVSTDNYQVNKYGWTEASDIRHAPVIRDRSGGYIIKLPKAIPLK